MLRRLFFRKKYIFFTLAIFAAFFMGIITAKVFDKQYFSMDRGQIVRVGTSKLISPILACEIGPESDFTELQPIKNSASDYINQSIKKHLADDVSIYFRLMNTGRWFEINDNIVYSPASLYKVVLLLAYYKEAEHKSGVLEEYVRYPGSDAPDFLYGGKKEDLVPGKYYSINELLDYMITKSYNSAMRTLVNHINPEILKRVIADLSIPLADNYQEEEAGVITPQAYSLIFRALYGASYLDRDMSERALSLLSRSDFVDGLRAGAPLDVPIAHKFGVKTGDLGIIGDESQLHDCGITYFPEHPYLLCIMTKGTDKNNLKAVISGVSKDVYGQVSQFFKNTQ